MLPLPVGRVGEGGADPWQRLSLAGGVGAHGRLADPGERIAGGEGADRPLEGVRAGEQEAPGEQERDPALAGDCSAGFRTAALPAASAAAVMPQGIASGKFHGEITAATPRGA